MAIPENDTQLWKGFNGHGLYAKRTERDREGAVIDTDYAKKNELHALSNELSDSTTTELTPNAAKAAIDSIIKPPAVGNEGTMLSYGIGQNSMQWASWESAGIDVPEDGVIIDGKRYPIVTIGDQQWMAENLAMPVGTINKEYRTTTEDGVELFFYAALNITTGNETMSELFASKLPEGWRIPTQSDFTKLATAVGNNSNSLKSTVTFAESTLGWRPHQSTNPTNATGFNLKPITRFNSGGISFSGESSVLLSSTKSGNWYFYYCIMGNSYTAIDFSSYTSGGIAEAYPVRLVKDL